jgi:hypothetical protein
MLQMAIKFLKAKNPEETFYRFDTPSTTAFIMGGAPLGQAIDAESKISDCMAKKAMWWQNKPLK